MRINNVDMEKISAFVEEVKSDKSKAFKAKKIEAEWVFEEGKPQFRALVKHGEKSTLLEADSPPFMGGTALKPDPVQYCLFGLVACFAQTLAGIAAEQDIAFKKLAVTAENKINLSKAIGLSEEPIVESVTLTIRVESSASQEKIKELEKLAKERCPGVYCLTNPIKLDINTNNYL